MIVKNIIDNILNPELSLEKKISDVVSFVNSNPDDENLELISRLNSMYKYTGLKCFDEFLFEISKDRELKSLFRIEIALGLLRYREDVDIIEKWDTKEEAEIKVKNNIDIEARNLEYIKRGYEALNNACLSGLEELEPAYRVQTIFYLMESFDYKDSCIRFFNNFMNDFSLDCDYRYKYLLSLEKKDNIPHKQEYIKRACLEILYSEGRNPTIFRLLSAQYLLTYFYKYDSDCPEERDMSYQIQVIILHIMSDTELDYNLRADAADILLDLGREDVRNIAMDTIRELGGTLNKKTTIFGNAQNVHTSGVEESVLSIINMLSSCFCSSGFESKYTIEKVVEEILAEVRSKNIECSDTNCSFSNCIVCKDKEPKFCSDSCGEKFRKLKLISASLDRIIMDRKFYTTNKYTLSDILVHLWFYIHQSQQEISDLLKERLIQELEDMSGTCSTGFESRLANVISGIDEKFSVRITFEDQVVSNFVGRMNKKVRDITNIDSPFFKDKKYEVLSLYFKEHPDVRPKLEFDLSKFCRNKKIEAEGESYLNSVENKEKALEECVCEFQGNVLSEMSTTCYKAEERPNFLFFINTFLGEVRNELYEEFKEYMNDYDFDLYMRKAIGVYEGISY